MRISVWNLVTNWPRTLKWWERFKLVFHPILIISILFISLVPSYFQQESLSRVYEGITLPSSEVSLNLNFTDPTTVHILFPYEIENNGFYDLSHINLRVALFIEYFHITTGEQHRSKVLYSKDEQGYARMGESYAGLYEKNFLDFNWEGIDAFVLDIDNNRPINVYMDIELSFILSGVEEDRIIFQGINLTSSTNSSMLINWAVYHCACAILWVCEAAGMNSRDSYSDRDQPPSNIYAYTTAMSYQQIKSWRKGELDGRTVSGWEKWLGLDQGSLANITGLAMILAPALAVASTVIVIPIFLTKKVKAPA